MIQLHRLTVTYPTPGGPFPVLRGIDLSLHEGEFTVLLGANGSGKTTLLRCLNGLILPTEGDVVVDGLSVLDPDSLDKIRRCVGMVFQNPDDQIVSVVVEREMAFGLENLGIPTAEMHTRVNEALDRFHLTPYRYHDPNHLSGGERQRLALAAVIAMRPRYLLLDEPTALLDPTTRKAFLTYLQALHTSGTTTPLLITQIPKEAVGADRVLVLDAGQIVLDGSPADVFSQTDRLLALGLSPPLPVQIAVALDLPPPVPLTSEELVSRLPDPPPPSLYDAPIRSTLHPSSAIISAHDLTYRYNPGLLTETCALNGLTLDISEGTVTVLIGPGGSGKSTFVRHLNGLLTPTSGRLSVCNLNPADTACHRDLRRQVGQIFQFPEAQLFADTVLEDVAFGPKNLGLPDIPNRVNEALQNVGLDPETFLNRSPLTLSGGEKRRVAIAGVLAMQPRVLVMDEPTAGLDPRGVQKTISWIERLKAEGCTLTLITHDLDLAARIGDRIVALQDGRVAFDSPPTETFTHPLTGLDLDLPETVHLANLLRDRSWTIPAHILASESLTEILIAYLKSV
ncbi:MAG: energy-coupling factor transporter ATPase [bacterium]|nr:energy-coupling factor transporter ATPase [bacterium]